MLDVAEIATSLYILYPFVDEIATLHCLSIHSSPLIYGLRQLNPLRPRREGLELIEGDAFEGQGAGVLDGEGDGAAFAADEALDDEDGGTRKMAVQESMASPETVLRGETWYNGAGVAQWYTF